MAPLTIWFYDAQFLVPYWRTLETGDAEARRWVQEKLVECAVDQLRTQVRAARRALGRDPVHIALMHGTAVMADTADRILEAYEELGVEFVSLEEAMRDPANFVPPPITTRTFKNFTQKWAEAMGVEVEGSPPYELLAEVAEVSPVEGMSEDEVFGAAFARMAQTLGVVPVAEDFDW